MNQPDYIPILCPVCSTRMSHSKVYSPWCRWLCPKKKDTIEGWSHFIVDYSPQNKSIISEILFLFPNWQVRNNYQPYPRENPQLTLFTEIADIPGAHLSQLISAYDDSGMRYRLNHIASFKQIINMHLEDLPKLEKQIAVWLTFL